MPMRLIHTCAHRSIYLIAEGNARRSCSSNSNASTTLRSKAAGEDVGNRVAGPCRFSESVAALSNNSRDRRAVPDPTCVLWAEENFDRQEGGGIVLGFGCWSMRQSKGGFH